MNERIEKLREKIKNTPFKDEFDGFIKNVQTKVEDELKNDFSHELVGKVATLVEEVKEILSRRDQGFRDLHAYLEYQREELAKHSESSKGVLYDVVTGLDRLSKSLQSTQKVSVSNPASMKITKAEMKAAFVDALDTVEKILVSQNEVPEKTEYEWTNDRLTKIVEFYSGFELVSLLKYDRNGKIATYTVERRT